MLLLILIKRKKRTQLRVLFRYGAPGGTRNPVIKLRRFVPNPLGHGRIHFYNHNSIQLSYSRFIHYPHGLSLEERDHYITVTR